MGKRELLDWISFGIGLEEKGMSFYNECLLRSEDARIKNLFEFLIQEEKRHRATLAQMADSINQDNHEETNEQASSYLQKKEKFSIFNEQELDKITSKDAPLSERINTAMDMEQGSIELYSGLAWKEKDESLRTLFNTLSSEEQKHKELLLHLGMKLI